LATPPNAFSRPHSGSRSRRGSRPSAPSTAAGRLRVSLLRIGLRDKKICKKFGCKGDYRRRPSGWVRVIRRSGARVGPARQTATPGARKTALPGLPAGCIQAGWAV